MMRITSTLVVVIVSENPRFTFLSVFSSFAVARGEIRSRAHEAKWWVPPKPYVMCTHEATSADQQATGAAPVQSAPTAAPSAEGGAAGAE